MKAPSVIIGVGGIGAEICAKVAQRLPKDAPDNEAIRFVIMDTDVNTIRDLHRNGFRGTEVQLSDNMTVRRCRESFGEAFRKEIDQWYPQSAIFDRKSMTEGAGQQRSISRLAFDYSIREGKLDPLYAVIRELNELTMRESNQQMRIYIISSLAGGTGSGIILPLALHLNHFIAKEFGDDLCICKGFFALSSALEGSVHSSLERKSLDSNAYAAVKELNAFMRMADGDKSRYDHIHMLMAQEDSAGYEKCQGAAYEYCYLFGMANERGKRVRSFEELKNLMANAVYMQSCSPIHDRNSSREDNTLKHITYQMLENGKNYLSRFGGIGCGELVYPYEKLKEYYALRWAVSVMGDEWQKYDVSYKKKDDIEKERGKSGKKKNLIVRDKEYINAIEAADSTDLLAEQIRNSCQIENENKMLWEGYLEALWNETAFRIKETRERKRKDYASDEHAFDEFLQQLKGDQPRKARKACANEVISLYRKLKPEILRMALEMSEVWKGEWFKRHPLLEEQSVFHMEYWLKKEGQFIHPNAVRFFLYHLKEYIEVVLSREERQKESCNSRFKARDQDHIQIRFLTGKICSDIYKNYEEAWNALYEYVEHQTYIYILKACQEYVNKLIKNYEVFYDNYEDMLLDFDEEKMLIEEELGKTNGITRCYVCADAECRDAIFKKISGERQFHRTGTNLSYRIFELLQESVDNMREQKGVFREIKRFWVEDLEQEYGDQLDLNIISAMDQEEECKYGRHASLNDLKDRITNMWGLLVSPFLQYLKTNGRQQSIELCCFNSELKAKDSRCRDMARWLLEIGGVDDPYYCSKYELVFYRSFVGLDAYEILEYLHKNQSLYQYGGRAFRYYQQTIKDMGKSKDGQSQITPHIDRKWHSLLNLPDLDSDYQEKVELLIAIAFLWAYYTELCYKDGERGYVFAFAGGQGKRFATLMDFHEFLYENIETADNLVDYIKLNRKYCDQLKEAFKGDDFLEVLKEYNTEISYDRQNDVLNELLVKAVWETLSEISEGEKEKIEKEVHEKFTKAFGKMNMDDVKLEGIRRIIENRLK